MAAKTATEKESQVIKLNPWQEEVACFFRAQCSMAIQTSEESRALQSLTDVVQHLGQTGGGCRDFFVWSACSFQKRELFLKDDTVQQVKDLGQTEFFAALEEFGKPNEVVPASGPNDRPKQRHKATVLVLCDPQDALSRPVNVRKLRETLKAINGWRKQIVIVARPFGIPKDIETELSIIDMPLPTLPELLASSVPLIAAYSGHKNYQGVPINNDSIAPFCRAVTGVTEDESRKLISLSLAKYRAFDDRSVGLALKEKERIVKRSEVLEARTCTGSLDDVGGLVNVKHYVDEITPILAEPDEARKYGLKLPSGILMVGVPGTGKSLTADKLAAQWKLPLLCMDVGRCMNQWQGQSEHNVREVFAIAKACAPCVLRIDEIEKALGGNSTGQESGTTERVKGTILTWFVEKPDDVFVVATANDLRKLEAMPELIRRFSEVFFVDLPDLRSRIEILSIHMRGAGHNVPADDLVEVAKAAKGFTGDECARVIQKALASSFKAKLPHPALEHLLAAARDIKPLKDTMKESIARLRQWSKEGRAKPAGATLEDDERNDTTSFDTDGLPDFQH
jgi:AAA+ superfamily predicted ATPase